MLCIVCGGNVLCCHAVWLGLCFGVFWCFGVFSCVFGVFWCVCWCVFVFWGVLVCFDVFLVWFGVF